MRVKALSILLCSCLLAGSIPHFSYGAEQPAAIAYVQDDADSIAAQSEGISLQSEGDAQEEVQEEPEPEPEP